VTIERDRMRRSAPPAGSPDGTGAAAADGDLEQQAEIVTQQAGIVTAASAAVSEHTGRGSAHSALPGVLVDVPVAVLVIDQRAGTVTYANTAAVELAGNVQLPVDVDTWGASAGLTDLSGAPLASTSGPLSLVAQGQPITGEAVRLRPVTSTEPDRAARGLEDQLLWVTGFPLSQAGSDEQLALVVFLKLDAEAVEDPDSYLQALRERAVVATDITFTITDPRQPDNPLVWVNPSFTRVTGYESADAVGRNCRFLQGPATDPAAVAEIRAALAERRPVTTTLLNYRRDGTAFWNQLAISPVFDGEGELVSFVGVQTDVTERVRVESERAAAFAAEQAARREAEQARAIAEQARSDAERARAEAERARNRLALMAGATTALLATLDIPELLDQLARLCVPRLADWAVVARVDESGEVRQSAARHRDGRAADLQEFAALHLMHRPEASPSRRSIATSRPVLLDGLTDADKAAILTHPGARQAFERLGGHSVLTVPMVARHRTLGALALVAAGDRRFTPDDVDLAQDLARRAALVLDNVRLYRRSTPSPTRCSARCCPGYPTSPASSRRRTTPARRTPPRSGATSTTCSPCPTARRGSWSATWSATTSPPRPPWGTCAASCGPAPGTPPTPTRGRSSPASTGWWRACTWPPWPRWSTPGRCRRSDPAAAGACRRSTPGTRRRSCGTSTATSRCSTGSAGCWSGWTPPRSGGR
jgi:PAS domain S-box-containing protein